MYITTYSVQCKIMQTRRNVYFTSSQGISSCDGFWREHTITIVSRRNNIRVNINVIGRQISNLKTVNRNSFKTVFNVQRKKFSVSLYHLIRARVARLKRQFSAITTYPHMRICLQIAINVRKDLMGAGWSSMNIAKMLLSVSLNHAEASLVYCQQN